ncbi:MAG: RIP metalloprotease RseP [Proteobacteria bacterium]|nr:RIP metalloprotease RseP [Pseudomonadota bacterium]MDA0895317.1 RIP metalloprotease RseP [Pseudomonadota bacterium]MDA1243733.1 RIP metalloprotease RseP [Pseudomonadota bacterium]
MIENLIEITTSVLALLVTLGILVTVHEFGHFWVARRCGVKVLKFSIGFGKAVKTWVGKDGVEYVIAPIPLGGYVRMLGQEDTSVADAEAVPAEEQEKSFASKSVWQRMAISAAGPAANFLLAIVIFWIINIAFGTSGVAPVISSVTEGSVAERAGLVPGDEIIAIDGEPTLIWQQVALQLVGRMGESGSVTFSMRGPESEAARDVNVPILSFMADSTDPRPLKTLGITQIDIPAVIDKLVEGEAGDQAGLLAGDRIVRVTGQRIDGWTQWVEIIRASPELELEVEVERGNQLIELRVTPALSELPDGSRIGIIGAYVQQVDYDELVPREMRREVKYNVLSAIVPAITETYEKSVFVLVSIKKMIVGLISVKNINGPITIAQVAGETASYGLNVYLGFLALLSISLGVMNLMPIPILDGGHILYNLIEIVTRRPVPEKVQSFGLQIGLLLISGIMMLAVYNDVARLL